MPIVADHRQRVLHALGVTPYALRTRHAEVAAPTQVAADEATTVAGTCPCVLVLPESRTEQQERLVTHAMQALGRPFAQASRVFVAAGDLRDPAPAASAYLAFGEAQARALGRSLPAAVMAVAEVLLLDDPQALSGGDGKRRLWQAVGGLRRHWRKTAAVG